MEQNLNMVRDCHLVDKFEQTTKLKFSSNDDKDCKYYADLFYKSIRVDSNHMKTITQNYDGIYCTINITHRKI